MAESSSFKDSRWSLHGMTALVTGVCDASCRVQREKLIEELGCAYGLQLVYALAILFEGVAKSGALIQVDFVSYVCSVLMLLLRVSSIGNFMVNNVGKIIRKPTTVYSAEEFSKVMATNFESAYHLSQIAHPLLKASGAGSIVFISSAADLMHLGTGSIYGASKGE
ncbi:hypothetical protein POTOM_038647 [Populus tomentosa]|uniref:Uncharacterized protein n=1 Tax=Populus tomentosa TaxID=118781 RepID=A0A8X7YZ11_POPTO|nr:hypothetical protein POTOM_038647 [Populus tomentosa]